MASIRKFVRWFDEINIDDVPLVGGKNASLGEMYRELDTTRGPHSERLCHHGRGISAFPGADGTVDSAIRAILADLNTDDVENLRSRGHQLRACHSRRRAAGRPPAGNCGGLR